MQQSQSKQVSCESKMLNVERQNLQAEVNEEYINYKADVKVKQYN